MVKLAALCGRYPIQGVPMMLYQPDDRVSQMMVLRPGKQFDAEKQTGKEPLRL
jgi:hypothetical protein